MQESSATDPITAIAMPWRPERTSADSTAASLHPP